jgi:segregation and condensation protein B
MEYSELAKKIEAILFAAGRTVSLIELKELCKEEDIEKLKNAAIEVKKKLGDEGSSILLTEEAEGYKFTVREKFLHLVQQIIPETELGRSVLETLAVIAWKQPLLQSEVIKIRSSAAYEHISELVDLGFVNKIKQGRSYVVKTTHKFAEYFDIPTSEEVKEIFKGVEEKVGKLPAIPGEIILDEQAKLKLGHLDVYSDETKVASLENVGGESQEGDTDNLNNTNLESGEPESVENKNDSKEEINSERISGDMTKEMFEEIDETSEQKSVLDALKEAEENTPEKKEEIRVKEMAEKFAKEHDKDVQKEKEVEETSEGNNSKSKTDDSEEDHAGRELNEELEKELDVDQPDFLHPKETQEEVEQAIEESEEIQREEKELAAELKEDQQEDIEIPEMEQKPEE